ncbi:glycoside hydrolase family 43 protein [Streptomyces sp. NPDC127072]|uniref:glycoside hydrolase family 43 protein n=1 Tax=Streptomyces sp. NPDC127072 TaxID=3347129 RepID=UPI00365E600B
MPSPRVASLLGCLLVALATSTGSGSHHVVPAAHTSVGAAVPAPVLDRNFPDPDIVKVGRTYHAYATSDIGRNVQHATSTDLTHWSVAGTDPLPQLGAWVHAEKPRVWAPEVYDNGPGFTMHYTAHDRASGRQCIGVALATSADGPFRPAGDGPLVCPVEQGGAIDAAGYTENGRRYLLWKSDGNCCEKDTWIHLQPISRDGTSLTGQPIGLIKQDRDWENGLIEAPTLIKRDGRYVLLYSADAYSPNVEAGTRYKTGYALAESLQGPYTKAAEPLMTTESFASQVIGPGGQDVVTGPDGRDRIAFHAWNADRTKRPMYLADLGFSQGRPVVQGITAP